MWARAIWLGVGPLDNGRQEFPYFPTNFFSCALERMDFYIGLDIGTGSIRACLIDGEGEILSVAIKDTKTWHERPDYYVCRLGGSSDFRNNRRKISGMLVVMSQDKS
jgi:hypothetical protein